MVRQTAYSAEHMYKIEPKDLPKASSILGQAFKSYPLFEHVLPDSASRVHQLKHLCQFLLRLGMSKGMVTAPSDAVEGVSIWLPSERLPHSAMDAVRAGLLNLVLHVNTKAIGRFIEIGNVKRRKRADTIGGSYWLCDMIGVDPLLQGRGVGRHMIEAQLNYLDKAKMPCYLETSEVRNIAYYVKYGFGLIHQYKIHSVHVYCLEWKPSALRETSPTRTWSHEVDHANASSL
jgi:GNAT superfamily N-acetyltransferase